MKGVGRRTGKSVNKMVFFCVTAHGEARARVRGRGGGGGGW